MSSFIMFIASFILLFTAGAHLQVVDEAGVALQAEHSISRHQAGPTSFQAKQTSRWTSATQFTRLVPMHLLGCCLSVALMVSVHWFVCRETCDDGPVKPSGQSVRLVEATTNVAEIVSCSTHGEVVDKPSEQATALFEAAKSNKDDLPSLEIMDPVAALATACRQDDVARCSALLAAHRHLASRRDVWGCTALHIAADVGASAVVHLLLKQHASVDARDASDDTPLHFSVRQGHLGMCAALLAAHADIDAVNQAEETPLLVAAKAGHRATCVLLLDRGASTKGTSDEELPTMLVSLLFQRIIEGGHGPTHPEAVSSCGGEAVVSGDCQQVLRG